MSNKLKASAKLSLLAAGVLAAGSVSANAEVSIFDYEAMGSGNDVRSELLNQSTTDYIGTLSATEAKLQEGKCGEGKCGEGKCGEGEEEEEEGGEEEEGEEGKEGEGKCGEGKCGEGKCGQ
jgi:uncharacterized low-complexity protein